MNKIISILMLPAAFLSRVNNPTYRTYRIMTKRKY
jgi:hypothetical protein